MPATYARGISYLALSFLFLGCGDRGRGDSDSGRSSPSEVDLPVNETNWDTEAGSLMVVSMGEGDTVAIVLPQATDSTLAPDDDSAAPTASMNVDLFGKGGRVASGAIVSPFPAVPRLGECRSWPSGKLGKSAPGWRVGFATGLTVAVSLDSINGMSSTDSSALAASIIQNVATIPAVSDPTFRGLSFRIRSAYTFRTDSVEGWIADVVRIVNEEANPKIEHLFLVGERPANSTAKHKLAYYSRNAGSEDAAEVTELLAVVLIGPTRRPAAVVNVEYDEGGNLGLLERTAPGQWRFRWRSAYTGC